MSEEMGRRIREARERINVASQAALAKLLEVDNKTISNWERGRVTPRGPALRRLAGVLCVTVEWLQLGGEYSPAAGPNHPSSRPQTAQEASEAPALLAAALKDIGALTARLDALTSRVAQLEQGQADVRAEVRGEKPQPVHPAPLRLVTEPPPEHLEAPPPDDEHLEPHEPARVDQEPEVWPTDGSPVAGYIVCRMPGLAAAGEGVSEDARTDDVVYAPEEFVWDVRGEPWAITARGDSMSPLLQDGAVVVYARGARTGQMVVARVLDEPGDESSGMHVVKWYERRSGRVRLHSEAEGHEAIVRRPDEVVIEGHVVCYRNPGEPWKLLEETR